MLTRTHHRSIFKSLINAIGPSPLLPRQLPDLMIVFCSGEGESVNNPMERNLLQLINARRVFNSSVSTVQPYPIVLDSFPTFQFPFSDMVQRSGAPGLSFGATRVSASGRTECLEATTRPWQFLQAASMTKAGSWPNRKQQMQHLQSQLGGSSSFLVSHMFGYFTSCQSELMDETSVLIEQILHWETDPPKPATSNVARLSRVAMSWSKITC